MSENLKKDFSWKYAKVVEGEKYFRCRFCNQTISGTVNRLKQHLAGTSRGIKRCPKVSKDVRNECNAALANFQEKRTKRNKIEMAKEAAMDAQNVGFHSMDCNNLLRDKKMNILPPADCQSFIDYMNDFQVKDPSFFYTVGVDAENRITNFFWRDGRSKKDYDYFGDAIILDTTFRMDIYDMICAPFVGYNHHREFVLLGCAFLLDETTESFIWLFQTFMKAMAGRQPKTIFTDDHPAMANAIGKVLPETQHRLCTWYICSNARKHLSENYRQPDFEGLFIKLILCRQSKENFHSKWDSLLEQYNLHENPWLQYLYNSREKWSHIFSKETFTAGIDSLLHGWGVNDVFYHLTTETMSLTKFARQYEEAAEGRRMFELDDDLYQSEPLGPTAHHQERLITSSRMEFQARNAYTDAVFELFQNEIFEILALAMEEIDSDGAIVTYKLTRKHVEAIVKFNCSDRTITCSCKLFESNGILCVHALKVLNARNIFDIPPQYILKRWTKNANSSLDMRKLTHKAFNLFTKCEALKDTREIAENYLDKALDEVEIRLKKKDVKDYEANNEDAASDRSSSGCLETQKTVLNSPCVDLEEVSKSTEGGIDHRSSGGLGRSNGVGGNPPIHANIYPPTQTPSTSTFHQVEAPIMPMDMQFSAPPKMPISSHYSQIDTMLLAHGDDGIEGGLAKVVVMYALEASLNGSEVLVRILDDFVDRNGFLSLAPIQWVRDDIINVVVCNLTTIAKQEGQSMRRCYLPTYYSDQILKGAYSKASFYLSFKKDGRYIDNMAMCEKMYVPMNYESLHWFLCIINFSEQKVEIWDSIPQLIYMEVQDDMCRRVVRDTEKFLESFEGGQVRKLTEYAIVRPVDIPLQQNWHDCGVYVIRYLQMSAMALTNEDLMDSTKVRCTLAASLLLHRDNKLMKEVVGRALEWVASEKLVVR